MSIAYRDAEERDRRFIVSGWSASYRLAYSAGLIAMEDWAGIMHGQIEKILARPTTETIVAYETEDPDPVADLQGFIAYELAHGQPPLVFYVYVKEAYRKGGLARGLFNAAHINPELAFDYACKTSVVAKLQRKMPLARWQPLRARFSKPEPVGDKPRGRAVEIEYRTGPPNGHNHRR